MKIELVRAFQTALDELRTELANERRALEDPATENDGEAAAIARNTIAAIEIEISEIDAARTQALGAGGRRRDEIERFKRWRVACGAVSVARARMEQLGEEIKAANHAADLAEGARAGAQNRLTAHLDNPVAEPNFAPQAKIRKWNEDRAELEARLRQAIDARVAATRAAAALRAEFLALDTKLHARPGGLLFNAEQFAPRQAQRGKAA